MAKKGLFELQRYNCDSVLCEFRNNIANNSHYENTIQPHNKENISSS